MSAMARQALPVEDTWEKRENARLTVLEACQQHFRQPVFEVDSDDSGVVWVRRLQGAKISVGLPPWLLRSKTIDELIERVETKLG
jgi:hypothetical protein